MKVYSNVNMSTMSGVAPRCSRKTASFHPHLATLTSIQNLGGSQASPPSIDRHGNYDHFRRTSSNQSKLLQYELTSCPSNHRIRIRELTQCVVLGLCRRAFWGVVCFEKLGEQVPLLDSELRVKNDIFTILLNSNIFFQITGE